MRISLATSLHLNHAEMSLDHQPGDRIPVQTFVPVGLVCLKAYAEARNVDADIRVNEVNGLVAKGFVANDERFYEELAALITRPDDDVVGLMTDADSLHHTILVASAVKSLNPKVHVCLGGPAASPMAKELLDAFDCIDSVVRGEGEVTFSELIACWDRGRLPDEVLGVTWRAPDGTVVENLGRPVIENLDTLPIPSFDAFGSGGDSSMYLDVGRGCPFKCQFCATAPYWDRRFRMKSVDRVLEELLIQRDVYGRDHVNFSHDIFTCQRRWARQFCDAMVEARTGMTWSCSTRTDVIDEALLEHMAAAGCDEIYYGIETGSQEMQRVIQKNLDLERSREIVAATAAVGIRPVTGFIVGYPMETRQTFNDTLRHFFSFLDAGGCRAHLFPLCPFHQAPMNQADHAIDRRAAYFEPPLASQESAKAEALLHAHPSLFRSVHRFAVPDVAPELVDACEELSSRLVGLKTLWPPLLPHYDSPLDWFGRWVAWIAARNAAKRPGTPMPHHGEAADLLDFVDEELERLGLDGTGLAELVRYERIKLAAAESLHPATVVSRWSGRVRQDAIVARGGEMFCERFDADLKRLLGGQASAAPVERHGAGRWVVFVKRPSGDLDTYDIGAVHARALQAARRPSRIRDVLSQEPQADLATEVRAVVDLLKTGLLVEVDGRSRREGGWLPGSTGEHVLQARYNTFGRAMTFYDRQVLEHLNPLMVAFIARQEMMFVATSDGGGECDCSFRAGPPGFVSVVDAKTLLYPEFRGNGVMASLGNIVENGHVGLFFADFLDSTVGLHVNGTAQVVEAADLPEPPVEAAAHRVERWVRVRIEEAYIHCSKHIPALARRPKAMTWGTDDAGLKGGDHFRANVPPA